MINPADEKCSHQRAWHAQKDTATLTNVERGESRARAATQETVVVPNVSDDLEEEQIPEDNVQIVLREHQHYRAENHADHDVRGTPLIKPVT